MKEKHSLVSCVYAGEGQTAAELMEECFRAFLSQQLAVLGCSGQQ